MGNAIMCETEKGVEMDGRTRFHRFRYHLGSGFVTPSDIVLDLGCGTGYGTDILSQKALEVRGYDMEQANIDCAILHHQGFNVVFECANLETMEIPEADVACSFEVIEHLYKPKEFVDKLKTKINNYIVVSIPLGQELVTDEHGTHEKGDTTHKSIFPTPEHFKMLFIDDTWKEFYSHREGVTLICVFYNINNIC